MRCLFFHLLPNLVINTPVRRDPFSSTSQGPPRLRHILKQDPTSYGDKHRMKDSVVTLAFGFGENGEVEKGEDASGSG